MDRVEAKIQELEAAKQAEVDRCIKKLDMGARYLREVAYALRGLDMPERGMRALKAADIATDLGTELETL